jgi:hypothetical protein
MAEDHQHAEETAFQQTTTNHHTYRQAHLLCATSIMLSSLLQIHIQDRTDCHGIAGSDIHLDLR